MLDLQAVDIVAVVVTPLVDTTPVLEVAMVDKALVSEVAAMVPALEVDTAQDLEVDSALVAEVDTIEDMENKHLLVIPYKEITLKLSQSNQKIFIFNKK